MIVKLLTEHHLKFLSLNGGSRGSSESTLVKMSKCWKSHAMAQFVCVQLLLLGPRSFQAKCPALSESIMLHSERILEGL